MLTIDGPNLVGTNFLLLNAQAGDALVVTGSPPRQNHDRITGNQITLSGSASLADYTAAMKLIAFENRARRRTRKTVHPGDGQRRHVDHERVYARPPGRDERCAVAQDGSASGNEDTPIGGTLVATDLDNPTLTYALGAQAANGTVVVNTDGPIPTRRT